MSAPTPAVHHGRPTRAPLLVLVLMAIIVVAAFAASRFSFVGSEAPLGERADMAKLAPAEMDVLLDSESRDAGGLAVASEPMAEPMVADDSLAAGPASVADDAKIVRTGTLELEVADIGAVLGAARGEIAGLGGYVAGSDEYDQGEQRWATVTYRVPVERFDEAVDAMRGLADRVVRETTQSQEVTAQVVDLDARIKNLRASEDALVAIMDRAGRIDDVLSVQLRLEDVRRQIEQLTAQRDDLAGRAALATLTAYWSTPVAAVTVAQGSWDLATQVDTALAQTVAALQGVASVLVWVAVVALPLIGIPLLVAVLALVAVRRRAGARGQAGPSGPAAMAGSASE